MEFFETMHVETKKDISIDEAFEDIVSILSENGYLVLGNIGTTEIHHSEKDGSKNCAKAFNGHYLSIKGAW